MKLKIVEENEADLNDIYLLIKTAFEKAEVKDGNEQDFAEGLRNSEKYIPELALVAYMDNKPAGHIMFTKTYICRKDGNKFEALLLAPLSVLIEYRNMGIGSALIKDGFRIARKLGYKAVFLVGNPAYYRRFGFKETAVYGIKPKTDIPPQYVMVYELEENSLDNINGTVECC